MNSDIVLHSTPIPEFRAMIGDIFREEFQKFKKETKPPSKTTGDYLSRKEVCNKLKISSATLYYWTKSGKLQSYRIGSRVLYKTVEVEEALCAVANIKNRRKGNIVW